MKTLQGGLAAASLLATLPAAAQELSGQSTQSTSPFLLDTVVFAAGLTALEAARTGVTVDVVNAEELEAAGDVPLADFLSTLPGISVTRNGSVGSPTILRLRGLPGYYTPVRINGIDVTDPSLTQSLFDFGALRTGAVSRIEVLRGSQSAIYGSEAIGGVIDITTAEPPQEPGQTVTLGFEAGSYETVQGSVTFASRFEGGTLTFSADAFRTEGFSAAEENNGNTEPDGHRSLTLSATGEFELTDTVTLGFSLIHLDSETEQDDFDAFFVPSDADERTETTRTGGRAYLRFDAGAFTHEFAASLFTTERRFPDFDPGLGESFRFDGDRHELSWDATREMSDATIAFGASISEESFSDDSQSGEARIASAYGEYVRALSEELDLSLALRHDDHSRFGGTTTGRAALAWRPGPDTVIRAAVATGFRAPSLYELFGNFGDDTLEPEQSRSIELGAEHRLGALTVSGTLFYTEIDDLIQFDFGSTVCGSGFGCYNQVPGTSVTKGVELAAEYEVNDAFTLFGNYAYTDATGGDGNRLLRVPLHDVTLGARGEIAEDLSASLTVQHVMDRVDIGGAVPDYTVADLTFEYALSEDAGVYLRIENLFDEEYQTVQNYGTSDRAFYLGLRARF